MKKTLAEKIRLLPGVGEYFILEAERVDELEATRVDPVKSQIKHKKHCIIYQANKYWSKKDLRKAGLPLWEQS